MHLLLSCFVFFALASQDVKAAPLVDEFELLIGGGGLLSEEELGALASGSTPDEILNEIDEALSKDVSDLLKAEEIIRLCNIGMLIAASNVFELSEIIRRGRRAILSLSKEARDKFTPKLNELIYSKYFFRAVNSMESSEAALSFAAATLGLDSGAIHEELRKPQVDPQVKGVKSDLHSNIWSLSPYFSASYSNLKAAQFDAKVIRVLRLIELVHELSQAEQNLSISETQTEKIIRKLFSDGYHSVSEGTVIVLRSLASIDSYGVLPPTSWWEHLDFYVRFDTGTDIRVRYIDDIKTLRNGRKLVNESPRAFRYWLDASLWGASGAVMLGVSGFLASWLYAEESANLIAALETAATGAGVGVFMGATLATSCRFFVRQLEKYNPSRRGNLD